MAHLGLCFKWATRRATEGRAAAHWLTKDTLLFGPSESEGAEPSWGSASGSPAREEAVEGAEGARGRAATEPWSESMGTAAGDSSEIFRLLICWSEMPLTVLAVSDMPSDILLSHADS